jgi:hypothetical protein
MKHLLIAIVFILAFSFCKNKTINNAGFKNELAKNDSIFRLSEHYSKFKFHDLTEFNVDSLDINAFKRIDFLAFSQIIQDEKKKGYYTTPYNSYFYYSTFSDSTLIAVLENSEENYGFVIWLLKYNERGQLKNKIYAATDGADGGDGWKSYGKSIKDNTFIRTDIHSSMIDDDIENGDEQIDSTIVSIKFDKNNKFKLDTIFKNQEIIKNKKK